jgi:hypothetical protein
MFEPKTSNRQCIKICKVRGPDHQKKKVDQLPESRQIVTNDI